MDPDVQPFAAKVYNYAGTNKLTLAKLPPELQERVKFPQDQIDRLVRLDLEYMGDQIGSPIKVDRGQYQIYGFFGCSSYSYYNLTYFAAKASNADPDGTKNADIITNGVTGSFYAMSDFTIKTVAPILNWSARGSRMTWQQIMGSYSKKYLTGVNGDE